MTVTPEQLADLIADRVAAVLWAKIEPALWAMFEDVLESTLAPRLDSLDGRNGSTRTGSTRTGSTRTGSTGGPWISAEDCSARYRDRLDRLPRWWREHVDEFGGWREGDGPKAPIRFDPAAVERALDRRRAA